MCQHRCISIRMLFIKSCKSLFKQSSLHIVKQLHKNSFSCQTVQRKLFCTGHEKYETADSECKDIIWMDMEMTGFYPNLHHILEVACLVTDKDLNVISEAFNVVIHQPPHVLKEASPWCKEFMPDLLRESEASRTSLAEAETDLLRYLQQHVPCNACPLAGSSIYMDRLFLLKHMPTVAEYANYKLIDVTCIRELAKRWCPGIKLKKKTEAHRALPDIHESLDELRHYSKFMFPVYPNY